MNEQKPNTAIDASQPSVQHCLVCEKKHSTHTHTHSDGHALGILALGCVLQESCDFMSQTESVPYQQRVLLPSCQAFMGASAVLLLVLAMLLLVVANGTSANVVQGAWPCRAPPMKVQSAPRNTWGGLPADARWPLLCSCASASVPPATPTQRRPTKANCRASQSYQCLQKDLGMRMSAGPPMSKGVGGPGAGTLRHNQVASWLSGLVFRTLRASPAPLICRALSPTECPQLAA